MTGDTAYTTGLRHYANAAHHYQNGRHDIAARDVDAALTVLYASWHDDDATTAELIVALEELEATINRERFGVTA